MNAMQKAISKLQKKCTPIKDENDFEYYATNNIVFAVEIAIKEAKKEVIDDYAKNVYPELRLFNKNESLMLMNEWKQRHLSTFAEGKSNIIADKQNPQDNPKITQEGYVKQKAD